MNTFSTGYATEGECGKLSELIADVIQSIPYCNDLAKRHEIQKFASPELQRKIQGDAYSVVVAYADNQIAGFCLSRFDDYTVWFADVCCAATLLAL